MPTSLESRAALKLVTETAVRDGMSLLAVSGSPVARRSLLLESVPAVISYYSDGSAALAADFYTDERVAAGLNGFSAQTVVADRTVHIRRGIAWAAEPLTDADETLAGQRLAEVIQLEVARPYRDTILTNRRQDPASVGWRRVTQSGCGFCRMLAARGAVYRESTARFAAHEGCHCTAQPVFEGQGGVEASTIQYIASKRNRTPAQQAQLRDYLAEFYGD
jgi:hypothetical protein